MTKAHAFEEPEIKKLLEDLKVLSPRQQELLDALLAVAFDAVKPVAGPDAAEIPRRITVEQPDTSLRLTIIDHFERAFSPGRPADGPRSQAQKVGGGGVVVTVARRD